MQSGDDSLWESFPHVLESLEGARRTSVPFELLYRSSVL